MIAAGILRTTSLPGSTASPMNPKLRKAIKGSQTMADAKQAIEIHLYVLLKDNDLTILEV